MRHLLWLLLLLPLASLQAEPTKIDRVYIDQSFIELYAGPDYDFEKVDVAQRGDILLLIRQQGNWFKVKTAEDRERWISYQQLLTCRTSKQGPLLSQVLPENWYSDRNQLTFAAGVLASSPAIQIAYARRLNDFLSLSAAAAGIALDSGSGVLYHAGFRVAPLDTESWKTYLELSAGGYFRSYDDDTIDSLHRPQFGIAGAVGYRLTDRINAMVRVQYHTLFKARLNEPDNLKGALLQLEYKF